MKTKRHSILARAAMTLLFTVLTTVTTWAWDGNGTQTSPYQITSTSDLLQLANDVYNGDTYSGKYFKLMNDLVFTTSTSNWYAIAPTFASIGTDTNPFEGTFDGDNHTLTGVYIYKALNNKGDLYQGLFGVIGSGGVVKNIILTDSKIAASNYSGAIAGENRGTITNCHVTSSVIVSPQRDYVTTLSWESCYVGGIAGNNASGATISKCSSGAKIWTHEITTSNSSGNVWTRSYGGIAGVNAGNLNNCFALGVNTGIVKSDYGAITGYSNGTLANNYYADCYIVGQSSNVGTTTSDGQVDYTTNDGAVKARFITLSEYTTTSSAKVFTIPAHKTLSGSSTVNVAAVSYNLVRVGATVTLGHGEHSIDSYFFNHYSVKDADNGNVTVNGNTFTMPDKNVTATAVFIDATWTGSGDSEDDPYIISTPEQLLLLARRVNNGTGPIYANYLMYYNKFFKVTADIEFTHSTTWDNTSSTENNFAAIGSATVGTTTYVFAGTFDGGGKAIKGIRIYQPDSYADQGLFGYITNDAVVKNVSLSDTRITAHYAGGIVGFCGGTVSNCVVNNTVGIIGLEYAHQHHGGIVGSNTGTIEGCRSGARLTYNGESSINWGGIAGSNRGTLKNNLAYGATVNCPLSGAIVGIQKGGTLISNYYYNCTIDGVENASNVGVTYDENNTIMRSDVDGARKGIILGKATGVTIVPTGESTYYDVSKITGYEGNNIIRLLNTVSFSGAGETVSLDITYAAEGFNLTGYTDGNGNALTHVDGNTYTLVMPETAVSVKPDGDDLWGEALSGRNGSASSPYLITTPAGLDQLASKVNGGASYSGKYFVLGNDITYDYAGLGDGSNYTSIGTESHPFSGNFNGRGYKLSGIKARLVGTDHVGLFGCVSGGSISNVVVDNCEFSGSNYAGAIAGQMSGTLSNCLVRSTQIKGNTDNSGAIIGRWDTGTVARCFYNNSSVNNYSAKDIAFSSGDNDNACFACNVLAAEDVSFAPVEATTATFSASGLTVYTSVLVYRGTLYMRYDRSVTLHIDYSGELPENTYLDGFKFNGAVMAAASGEGNYILNGYEHGGMITPYINYRYWTGSGTEDDPYVITTKTAMKYLADEVNSGNAYDDKHFALGTDLVYDGTENNFTCIGTMNYGRFFRGNFDGRGHTISGINVKRGAGDSNSAGIFGGAAGSGMYQRHYIRNLTVTNSSFVSVDRDNLGSISGYASYMVVENCHVGSDVIVSGRNMVGGVLGQVGNSEVKGCSSGATVIGKDGNIGGIGGICGDLGGGRLEDNVYYGQTVYSSEAWSCVGAIAGYVDYSTIERNYYVVYALKGIYNKNREGTYVAKVTTSMPAGIGNKRTTYGGTQYPGLTVYDNGIYYQGKYYWHENLPQIEIVDNSTSNESDFDDYDGNRYDVKLTDRKLYKDGRWNTIYLPFDVDLTDIGSPLYGATVRTVTSASITGTTLNLTFAEKPDNNASANILYAGVPYIIKWDKASDYVDKNTRNIVDPLFSGVTFSHKGIVINGNGVSGYGTYDAKEDIVSCWSPDPDGNNGRDVLLLTGDRLTTDSQQSDENDLYYATSGINLGACRAYFTIDPTKIGSGGQTNARLTDYVMNLGNGETLSGTFPLAILPGDANGDGDVTITDAVAVVNYILGNPSENFNKAAANVNGDTDEDGEPIISITDAVGIVNIILNKGATSAPEVHNRVGSAVHSEEDESPVTPE